MDLREASARPDLESRLQALLDKDEIAEVLHRYTRGLDRADAGLMQSAFHPDAVQEHAGVNGDAHGFCVMAADLMRSLGPVQHFVTNVAVNVTGNAAQVSSYGLAFQRCRKDGVDFDSVMGCRLLDRFEHRDGAWKIAHRVTLVDWNHDIDSSETFGRGVMHEVPEDYRGRKDTSDRSYRPV